ncbi:DUF3800 domain-containing protein [Plesiomonas shigelloides]|uniref:DUF3800 domain-containing protein n=1 Tax=Plesiomonas shigelloides TaxID=703 RepID=UPI0012629616|nr:DUF3800 domain-containing protein [Plesiomonas shigelloides]KAB7663878.1 DUF3800 domain-containing protein [Plesiomonas shigelloides]
MFDIEIYCDESGRLGYINNPENYSGEITLVAGFIIDSNNTSIISDFCNDLHKEFSPYLKHIKHHITDLPGDIQKKIRHDTLHFIKDNNIIVVYAANYFQSLHIEYLNQKQRIEDISSSLKSDGIGFSKNTSMFNHISQVTTFSDFYIKAMTASLLILKKPVSAIVKTDMISEKYRIQYLDVMNHYHSLFSNGKLEGKHYDLKTGEKNNFGVSVKIQSNAPLHALIRASKGTVEIVDSHTSIISDVITNSLHHHLITYAKRSNNAPLHSTDAISEYILSNNICHPEIGGVYSTYHQ